jgi:hypothetical protein
MTGGKGAHGGSRFIRHLRMKRALGLPYSYNMWPARQMRDRDRRRGELGGTGRSGFCTRYTGSGCG